MKSQCRDYVNQNSPDIIVCECVIIIIIIILDVHRFLNVNISTISLLPAYNSLHVPDPAMF